jgi:Cohesin domain
LAIRRGYRLGRAAGSLCRLMLFVLAYPAQGASLRIPWRPLHQGRTIKIPVLFAAEGSAVCGIQFDLNYDSSVLEIQFTSGKAAERALKQLYTADINNGKRIMIVGLNRELLEDGVLLHLHIKLLSEDSATVMPAISDVFASDPDGQPVPVVVSAAE